MKRICAILATWAAALAVGLIIDDPYVLTVATATAFLGMFAQSWNLQSGFTGNLSVGHSTFIAVPAYITLILFQQFGVSPIVGGLIGVLAAVALAALIGGATLRLRGPYFALATLAASAVVLGIILHFSSITNGPSGITIPFTASAPLDLEFTDVHAYYAIAVTLLAAVTMFVSFARRSKLGYFAAAIKSSEEAAAAAGISVAAVKVTVFCLSAASIAFGSVVYVFFIGFADPNFLAGVTLSVEIALMSVIGGLSYLVGPILGAIFYEAIDVSANAFLGASGGWDTMILGFSVVLLVMTEPRGLCELAVRLAQFVRRRCTGTSNRRSVPAHGRDAAKSK